ncbi:MAG: sulfate adenylyltransferase, partial [Gemmatimonadetes bacterium]|nr:sulfate adenylyltransferase [Gemmatimonadota bacterium]
MSIAPHGGTLINRRVSGAARDTLIAEAANLPRVDLDERQLADLDMIAVGAMSPLSGFLGQADYEGVVHKMRLADGTPWPLPITLRVEQGLADSIDGRCALYGDGKLLAVMDVKEKFTGDKKVEAVNVYKTDEEAHPGVAALYGQGDVMLGGDIHSVNRIEYAKFNEYRHDPDELRAKFDELGWKTVVAFQTRNPIHRAHEYLIRCAMEMVDGALIHPLVGATKSDDIDADVRVKCYEVLMENYFPKDRIQLAMYPAAMRYAGPREAIFHAITRQNYGCSHFIVGRDHAGVGSYYGTYDAHYIFGEFDRFEIDITPMFFDHSFFCRKCGNMASSKT